LEKEVEKIENPKGTVTLEVAINATFAPINNTPVPVATKNISNTSVPNSKK
jgi:hypothetical protein